MRAQIPIESLALASLLVGAAAWSQDPPSPPPHPPKHPAIQKGDQHRIQGERSKAIVEYDKARQSSDPVIRNTGAIKAGETRVEQARTDKNKKAELLDRAAQDFKQVVKDENATPKQRANAYNNLATVYLNQHKTQEALDALKACDKSQIDKNFVHVVHYNQGIACEQNNNATGAFLAYRDALRSNPSFYRAADRAIELIKQPATKAEALPAACDVGRTLLVQGDLVRAKYLGLTIIQGQDRWGPQASWGLEIVLGTYARIDRSPADFRKDEESNLGKIRKAGFQEAADEIQRAYEDKLELNVQRPGSREVRPFFWFSSSQRDPKVRGAFVLLLNHAGDSYAVSKEGRDPKQALARYLAAYAIDGNSTGAKNVAWIISNFSGEIGDSRVYDRFVNALMDEKGSLYAIQNKSREDWVNILRLHLLLGMMFESRGQWGSESTRDSAISQWRYAVAAESKVREFGGGANYGAPGLHEHLAKAYLATKQPGKAFDSYLKAGEAYHRRREKEQARDILAKLRMLDYKPEPAQQAALQAFVNMLGD